MHKHKKFAKAITGSLIAATMLTTSATAFIPMSASAGDMLGQHTFDEGVGLPWHVCQTSPANQYFELTDGQYVITIDDPGGAAEGGESRWDLQFRHRGLKIQSGHKYAVHWEVEASADVQIYTKIGDLSGDIEVWHNNCNDSTFNSTWDAISVSAGKHSYDSTFIATQTLEVAEWAFHYGGAGDYQATDCTKSGDVLKFDNMYLTCETCDDTSGEGCNWDQSNEMGVITPRSDVRINQVGYWTNLTKKASYATDEQLDPVTFHVVDSSGNVAFTGTGEDFGYDESSGEYVQILDFTDIDVKGEDFHIEVEDETNTYYNEKKEETYQMWVSHDFDIVDPTEDNAYDDLLTNALNYYYQNRSGVDIESAYITSGDTTALAHQGGHNPDLAYVQSAWVKSYTSNFSNGDTTYQIEGTGGWYDAGDHGKYVVNGGISVWTLQNMYEVSTQHGTDSKWTSGAMVIPESGDANPDILDETRVELEWMFKMIVSSSDPYYGSSGSVGNYTNMVYHKLHDHKWTGLATRPWDYADEWGTVRIVKPPSTAATLNLVACAAQAARLWKGYDDDFAAGCLANAKKCYEAAKSNPDVLAPLDQAIGGGAYGDSYVGDDFYWAACELYITTGDTTYYNDLKSYSNPNDETGNDKAFSLTTNLTGGENAGSFSSFNWGCTAGLGTLSLYLHEDLLTTSEATAVETAITNAADEYIDQENSEGMGIPYRGATFTDPVNIGYDSNGNAIEVTGYEWGSNSFVVNNAIVMAYAYMINGTNEYISGVSTALDYIFGRNGLGISYVTGTGTYYTSNPHHRYWSYEIDHSFPMAPDGVLSGGPGSGLQDPYVGGLGYIRGEVAPQKCYVDSVEAWSVNEVTINWNAPFAWVISFIADEIVEAPDVDEDPTDDDDLNVTLWGDADIDGDVDIADVTLIMSYVNNPSKYPITAQGLVNADVNANGDGISNNDALAIQRLFSKVIDSLPESYS
ncbi:MAG: glycoside hydrolase family 9 protein [Ruminococcus sp.]|nr:glycoside hydrolase family 9 protein [Ruminococcus sp.]